MKDTQLKTIHRAEKFFKLTFLLICLFASISIITLIGATFSPRTAFSIEEGLEIWRVNYPISEITLFTSISTGKLAHLQSPEASAKGLFIVSLFTIIIYLTVVGYITKLFTHMLHAISTNHSPFTLDSVYVLKRIGWIIIIMSLLVDIFDQLLYAIFVTKIFYLQIQLNNIDYFLVGLGILVISHVFYVGYTSQKAVDATF